MKKLLLWFIPLLCFPFLLSAQTGDFTISINNQSFTPASTSKEAMVKQRKVAIDPALEGAYQYYLVQFYELPDAAYKAQLKSAGVELLYYIPNNAYITSVPAQSSLSVLNTDKVRAIVPYTDQFKISPELKSLLEGKALESEVQVKVTCFNLARSRDYKTLLAKQFNAEALSYTEEAFLVNCTIKDLSKLSALTFVEYIDVYHEVVLEGDWEGWQINSSARENYINSGLTTPLINGSGVTLWNREGGTIEPINIDVQGRVFLSPNSGLSGHKNNTTECMGNAGNKNPLEKMFAWGCDVLLDDASGNRNSFYSTRGMRYANSSWGSGWAGSYNGEARDEDNFTYTNPLYARVFSAGNSGGDAGQYAPYTGVTGGYANITGAMKTGKNMFTVGAVDRNDNLLGFSSRGPIYDGRVKPELVIHGEGGTSYAAPRMAGVLALLNQAYKLNNGVEPPSQLLKAVLINTADDVAAPGLDYQTGYGKANVRRAYNTIKDKRILTGSVANGATNTHTINVPANTYQVRVSIVWADYAAAVNASKSLVNNLNMTVTTNNGSVVNPWVLNPAAAQITAQATRGVDNLNNMEQVTIDAPAAGSYTIRVNGATVPFGPQTYFVTYEFVQNEIFLAYPMGGESFVPGERQYVRWDYYGTDTAPFILEYSTNSGTSWTTISNSIASNRRYYEWSLPNITQTIQVRVRKGTLSDATDSPVSLIRIPVPEVAKACSTSVTLQWPAVTGATGYDIYRLGTKYMELVGSSATTEYTVAGTNSSSTYYFAVSAKGANGLIGRRSNALLKEAGEFNCGPGTPVITKVATVYQDCSETSGYKVGLEEGSYTTAKLSARGVNNNDVSSLKINAGYEIVVYDDDNFQGTSYTFRSNVTCLTSSSFNDRTGSLIVRSIVPNQLPTVSITSPSNNATFNAPANLTITANAADPDGTVANVAFFNGAAYLGADFTAPYSFDWNGVAAGTYNITARVTDNKGVVVTSSVVKITVNQVTAIVRATIYQDCSETTGYKIGLEEGSYTTAQLAAKGILNNDASSLKITSGYEVVLYDEDNFQGTWMVYRSDVGCLTTTSFNDRASSLRVRPITVNVLPTVSITSPANNSVHVAPANLAIQANAADADGLVLKVDFYNGSVLLGSDNSTPYTYAWNNLAVGTYAITARVTDNSGVVVTSSVVNVTVNDVPVMRGTVYQHCGGSAGYVVELEQGDYTTAQLAAKGILNNDISSLTVTSGYEIVLYDQDNFQGTWQVYRADAACLTSTGFNDLTSSLKIRPVTVNVLPTVSISSPANNAIFTTPANLSLTASAADADGLVLKVDFYNGTTLLGSDNSAPYTYAWNNVAVGSYSITARVTDNSYVTVTSSAVTVVVNTPVVVNQPPSITLTAPANNQTYNAPASVTITAAASDADGTVSKVEFYSGSLLLGSDATAPYSFTWTNVAAGNYSISAKVTDNNNTSVTSAVAAIVVNSVAVNGCSNIASYVENGNYVEGSKVKNANNQYMCKPWPYSGWCNGAAWAYAPGTGAYWSDAWTLVGSCTAARASNQSATNDALLTNAPNPFVNSTTIEVTIEEAGELSVEVFNKSGQLVKTISGGFFNAGTHRFEFDAAGLPSDLYIVKCNTMNNSITRKMVKAE
ncbi:MAG: hypothetical protein K0R51_2288 [Cytophagaceae bacterium]|jgi:hypothetical protein|nr:hypothetical protein [Cytophagaceae bacterium]